MDNFSRIQCMAIQDYICNIVTSRGLNDICLDITNICQNQLSINVGTNTYYLLPVHNKDKINKIKADLILHSTPESIIKETIANLYFKDMVSYRANKFVFTYFQVNAYDENGDIITSYNNTDATTESVINYIIANGLSDTSRYLLHTQPRTFYRIQRENEVMQYKGYNYREIKEWIADATIIISDIFQNNKGLSYLCDIGPDNKPVYLLMNSYIIKTGATEFIILRKDAFEALFTSSAISTDTVGNYFYGSDISYSNVLTATEILNLEHRSTELADVNTRFELSSNAGDTRIVIAYPASIRDIQSIVRADYYDGDIKSVFRKSIVGVELVPGGEVIDYKVYTYIPGQPFVSDMRFIVTL